MRLGTSRTTNWRLREAGSTTTLAIGGDPVRTAFVLSGAKSLTTEGVADICLGLWQSRGADIGATKVIADTLRTIARHSEAGSRSDADEAVRTGRRHGRWEHA